MLAKYALLVIPCVMLLQHQAHAQPFSQKQFYEDMLKSADGECTAFADRYMKQVQAQQYGPREQQSLRNRFYGTCYGPERRAIDYIDDFLSVGKTTPAILEMCVKKSTPGEYSVGVAFAQLFNCSLQGRRPD